MDQLSFQEALETLADLTQVTLPAFRGVNKTERSALMEIHDLACQYYRQRLKQSEEARAYLDQRGIQHSSRELFGLGYASEQWDGLALTLASSFSKELLLASGLVKESKRGTLVDLFRHRLMFPIRNAQGQVIAFGGRALSDDGPKYINSPETPLFKKSKHVYNLDMAKNALKKDPYLLVVEGYLDVIQLFQNGFMTTIAPLGTAFTDEHGQLLRRHTQKVILCFDGDSAGQKAAHQSLPALLRVNMDVSAVLLPESLDPDDFLKSRGQEAFRQLIDQALPLFDLLTRTLGSPERLTSMEKSAAAHQIAPILAHFQDPVLREDSFRQLSERLNLSINTLQQVVNQSQTAPLAPQRAKGPKNVHGKGMSRKLLSICQALATTADIREHLAPETWSHFEALLRHQFDEETMALSWLRPDLFPAESSHGEVPPAEWFTLLNQEKILTLSSLTSEERDKELARFSLFMLELEIETLRDVEQHLFSQCQELQRSITHVLSQGDGAAATALEHRHHELIRRHQMAKNDLRRKETRLIQEFKPRFSGKQPKTPHPRH
jgi:DNA primase catalytic core